MSRKNKVIGTCHICGKYGELSFEHTPPRKAFNDRSVIRMRSEDVVTLGPDEIGKGEISQKGVGEYTLCHKCNNDTGSWYGNKFIHWCYQGMEILSRSGGDPSLIYMNYLFPLEILKQIITMFLSVNGGTFATMNPELVRFVLNKSAKYLSPRYRFFIYYNVVGKLRFSGIVGQLKLETNKLTVMSEITYPPFGYLMCPERYLRLQSVSRLRHF